MLLIGNIERARPLAKERAQRGWWINICSVGFLLLAVGFCLSSQASAASPAKKLTATAEQPDPAANPVLALLIKGGARFYYLGNRDGLDGWLMVKESRIQVAYALPHSQDALFGILLGPGGEEISTTQAKALLVTHSELTDILSPYLAPKPAAAGTAPPVTASPAAQAVSPGERLLNDLQGAAGVTIGNTSAPLVMMVMDPDCPHCQATWRSLREAVMQANRLQLKLIPVTVNDQTHEHSAQLLHVADPLTAWDKYIAGDKSQLAGAADPAIVAAIEANDVLADSWHIPMTPYLVYRGRDGKVKIIQGEPQVPDLLADLP